MRITKFRYVWKGKSSGQLFIRYLPIEEIEKNNCKGGEFYHDVLSPDWILIARDQYIGITDKNKIPIYESDRVEGDFDDMDEQYTNLSATVKWFPKSFCYKALNKKTGYCLLTNDCKNLKVIGNIHQGNIFLEKVYCVRLRGASKET